jgi:hypothetical protein
MAAGCELMQRAMTLNPRHPGWYWFPYVTDAYFRQEYSRALDYALRLTCPASSIRTCGSRPCTDSSAIVLKPRRRCASWTPSTSDFGSHAKHELDKWLAEGALVEHWLEGLRKAGLAITEGGPAPVASDR